MANKQAFVKRASSESVLRRFCLYLFRSGRPRTYIYAGVGLLVASGLVGGIHKGRMYARDAEGLGIRTISVAGLRRVSENEILARASHAPGGNIWSLNLEETRKAVEEIPWVRNATIQRVWPNEIVISVVEREPIALARIDSEIFEVDVEGVVLAPDLQASANSPILDGLSVGDPTGNEFKIGVYREIVEAVGESELSEVHVAESGEVSVVPSRNPILVNLGLTNHKDRWERYLRLSERIRQDYPDALGVDLRFEGQVVIRTSGDRPAENILWGEETRLL